MAASHQLSDQIGVVGSEERCYQTAERGGPLGACCRRLSLVTSRDNIRQGLNQQTRMTLGDQAGYLQLCREREEYLALRGEDTKRKGSTQGKSGTNK